MGLLVLPLAIVASGMAPPRLPAVPAIPSGGEQLLQAVPPLHIDDGADDVSSSGQSTTPPVPPQKAAASGDGRDIVITARRREKGDPLAPINLQMYSATQAVDRTIVKPVAIAYERAVPSPMRDGLRNFFDNLHEPVVFLNYLLQLKPGKAAETAGRFVVNTTIGIGGVLDIAKRKPFRLPRRRNGFSDTLGFYGVKPGPFLFLPLIGPTTVRDLIGGIADRGIVPLYLGMPPFNKPVFAVATGSSRLLDKRDRADDRIEAERATSDPYAAARDDYLNRRAGEIGGLHAGGTGKTPATQGASPPRAP